MQKRFASKTQAVPLGDVLGTGRTENSQDKVVRKKKVCWKAVR